MSTHRGALARRVKRAAFVAVALTLTLRFASSRANASKWMPWTFRSTRVDACDDARVIVERWMRDAGASSNVACFVVGGNGGGAAHAPATRGARRVNAGYLKSAKRFLRDVEAARGRVGLGAAPWRAVWTLEDDATPPAGMARELAALGVATLAHSMDASAVDDDVVLVPNFHFIKKRGFKRLIETLEADERAFEERENAVFWRGSTTGVARGEKDGGESGERVASMVRNDEMCARLPRVRAALLSRDAPWLDVAVTRRVQACRGRGEPALSIASHVPERRWIENKGILEIDGNVDAWGNRWRMESGSVVFLVQSNFKHYYTDKLKDGVHYIGIAPDLSDLVEKTRLVTKTDPESLTRMRQIAGNARARMRELTYERAVEDVAGRLFAPTPPRGRVDA